MQIWLLCKLVTIILHFQFGSIFSKFSMQIWLLCKLVTIILHFQFGSIFLFTKNAFTKKSIEIKLYWELWDEELNERKASQFL